MNVYLLELTDNNIQALQGVNLSAVPNRGDKIALTLNQQAFIFEVVDIVFAHDELTDVYIKRLSTTTEYLERLKKG